MNRSHAMLCELAMLMLFLLIGYHQSMAQSPINDLCTAAEAVAVTPFNSFVDTTLATPDSIPLCDPVTFEDLGVWYVLPGNDRIATVEISSTGITSPKIAIFSGTCESLTCVTSRSGRSLSWEALLGMEYRILLTGNGGVITFMIAEEAPPSNDKCENATEFLSLPMSESGTTVGSLSDDIDTCSISSSSNNRGVWYTFVPVIDSFITVTTSVASFAHEVVLLSGDSCELASCSGVQSATFDSTVGSTSITFIAEAGTRYYVLVTGYRGASDAFDDVGTFDINIEEIPRPPNDNCENATEFLSLPISESGTSVGSLSDDIDTCSISSSSNNRGVWYTFVSVIDSSITVTTSVASFAHEIVLLSGVSCELATCSGVQSATFDSTVGSTSITFIAEAGTRYYVLVTGYRGASDAFDDVGTFMLSVTSSGNVTSAPVAAPVILPSVSPVAAPVVAPSAPVTVPMTSPNIPVPVILPSVSPVAVPVVAPSAPVTVPMTSPNKPIPVIAPSLFPVEMMVSSAPFAVMYWMPIMTMMMVIKGILHP